MLDNIEKEIEYRELIILIDKSNSREEYYHSPSYKELFNILSLSEQIDFLAKTKDKHNPVGVFLLKNKLKEGGYNLNITGRITTLFEILDANEEYETILKLSNQIGFKSLAFSNQRMYFKSIFNVKNYNLIYESLKVVDILTVKLRTLPMDKQKIDDLWLLYAYACNKVSDYKESYGIYEALLDEEIFRTDNYVKFKTLLIKAEIKGEILRALSNTLLNYVKELDLAEISEDKIKQLNNITLFCYRFLYESIEGCNEEDKYLISIEYKEILDRLNILLGYESESLVQYLTGTKDEDSISHEQLKGTLTNSITESFFNGEYKEVVSIYEENKSILINDRVSCLQYFRSLFFLKEYKTIINEFESYRDKYASYTISSSISNGKTITDIYNESLKNIESVRLSELLIDKLSDNLLLQPFLSLEIFNLLENSREYLLEDIKSIVVLNKQTKFNSLGNIFNELYQQIEKAILQKYANNRDVQALIRNSRRRFALDKEELLNTITENIEGDIHRFIEYKGSKELERKFTDSKATLNRLITKEAIYISYFLIDTIYKNIKLYENVNAISNEYRDVDVKTENILSSRFNYLLGKINQDIANLDNECKFLIFLRTLEASFIVKYYDTLSYRDTLLLYKKIKSASNIRTAKELYDKRLSTVDSLSSELHEFLFKTLHSISDTYKLEDSGISIIKDDRYFNRLLELDIENHNINALSIDNEYNLKLLSVLNLSNKQNTELKTPQYSRLRYTLIEILYKCKDNHVEGFNLIFDYIQNNQNSILLLNSGNIDALYKELSKELKESIFFLNTNTISSSITYLVYGYILDKVFHMDNDVYQRIYDSINLYLSNQIGRYELTDIIIETIRASDLYQKLNIINDNDLDLLKEELTIVSDSELFSISKQFTDIYREVATQVNEYAVNNNVLNREELTRQLSSIRKVHSDIDTYIEEELAKVNSSFTLGNLISRSRDLSLELISRVLSSNRYFKRLAEEEAIRVFISKSCSNLIRTTKERLIDKIDKSRFNPYAKLDARLLAILFNFIIQYGVLVEEYCNYFKKVKVVNTLKEGLIKILDDSSILPKERVQRVINTALDIIKRSIPQDVLDEDIDLSIFDSTDMKDLLEIIRNNLSQYQDTDINTLLKDIQKNISKIVDKNIKSIKSVLNRIKNSIHEVYLRKIENTNKKIYEYYSSDPVLQTLDLFKPKVNKYNKKENYFDIIINNFYSHLVGEGFSFTSLFTPISIHLTSISSNKELINEETNKLIDSSKIHNLDKRRLIKYVIAPLDKNILLMVRGFSGIKNLIDKGKFDFSSSQMFLDKVRTNIMPYYSSLVSPVHIEGSGETLDPRSQYIPVLGAELTAQLFNNLHQSFIDSSRHILDYVARHNPNNNLDANNLIEDINDRLSRVGNTNHLLITNTEGADNNSSSNLNPARWASGTDIGGGSSRVTEIEKERTVSRNNSRGSCAGTSSSRIGAAESVSIF